MPALLGRASLFGGRLGAFAIDNMVQVRFFACISVRIYCPAMHCTGRTRLGLAAEIVQKAVVSIVLCDASGIVQIPPVSGGGASLANTK